MQAVVDLYSSSLDEHGAETLELIRKRDPSTYMRLAMQFVPSKVGSLLEVNVTHELSDEFERIASFADAYRVLEKARDRLGAKPMVIDIQPETVDEVSSDD